MSDLPDLPASELARRIHRREVTATDVVGACLGRVDRFNKALNAVVTLFVTIDPPGLAPIFVVLTAGRTRGERNATALRATVIAGAVLVAFALVGQPLIGVLGISLPAFRIAGGLLLVGSDMRSPMSSGWRRRRLNRTSGTRTLVRDTA